MPGTFIFRPIEATIKGEAALGSYSNCLDPLCQVKIGDHKFSTHPSKHFGIHPEWDESLVVQEEGEKNLCTISLLDNNKMNPNRHLGKFNLNLDEIYTRGRITRLFDLCKEDCVQGQLLMDVTYTQANPISKLFHQSLNPGAGVDNSIRPFNYFDHKDASHRQTKSAQKEVQEELSTLYSPKSTATMNQLHMDQKNPADTSKTMKLEVNYPHAKNDLPLKKNKEPEEKPEHHHHHHLHETQRTTTSHLKNVDRNFGNKTTRKDKQELKKHLGTVPPERVDQLLDPTLNELHLDRTNPSDTGMSNPNTMKLGVNHEAYDPTYNIRDSELAGYPFENLNYGDENDIYSGGNTYNKERYSADTGMSNPNLIGLRGERQHEPRQTNREGRKN